MASPHAADVECISFIWLPKYAMMDYHSYSTIDLLALVDYCGNLIVANTVFTYILFEKDTK